MARSATDKVVNVKRSLSQISPSIWAAIATAASLLDAQAASRSSGVRGIPEPLTQDVLGVSGAGVPRTPEERLAAWTSGNEAAVAMTRHMLGEIWESERFTFTTLSVALRAIRTLVAASSLPQA